MELYTEKGELIDDSSTKDNNKMERFFKFRYQEMTQLLIIMKPKAHLMSKKTVNKRLDTEVDIKEEEDELEKQKKEKDPYYQYKDKMPKLFVKLQYLPSKS
jgi:hypothetical protein